MDFSHGEISKNVEIDRLSSLPNDLIHQILSFMDIKDLIGTSVLSSRWRFIWTSMPYLNVSTHHFSTLPQFSQFVTNVLSHRNSLTEVHSMKLNLRVKGSHVLLKKIMSYAFSHNIQELNVVCVLGDDNKCPLSLFSSQSLKHLSLTMHPRRYSRFTSTWDVPMLTTLVLISVTLCRNDGFLSNCANLKNLTISQFKTTGSNRLSIVHSRLSNLTIKNAFYTVKVISVATPKLKNLTIKSCVAEHVNISAPDLVSLIYRRCLPVPLTKEGFHSLEKADVCLYMRRDANARKLLCMLQQLHSVKFLKLNWEMVEILSSSVHGILNQPSPFVNLKSLEIYLERYTLLNQAPKNVGISTKLKSYLLDGSSGGAIVTFTLQEIQAQNLMDELRSLLEKESDNSKTKETQVESHEPKNLKIGANMEQIKNCWDNLAVQIEKARLVISKVQEIEELLSKVLTSKRSKLQSCFSSLCTEADTVINQVTDYMKIHCDENQSLSSVCATTLESFS